MEITYIYNQALSNINPYICLIIKLHSKDVYLFNCIEGYQNYCIQAQVKISQISTIIISDLKLFSISGLIGLLSSLSLANRTKDVYIYAPIGIEKYLELVKKYSKTNFKYNLFIIFIYNGFTISSKIQTVYSFANYIQKISYDFIVLNSEKYRKFDIGQAYSFQILLGPLYGQLKHCCSFLLPDGLILNGNQFIEFYHSGDKFLIVSSKYHTRKLKQIMNRVNFYFINHSIDTFN